MLFVFEFVREDVICMYWKRVVDVWPFWWRVNEVIEFIDISMLGGKVQIVGDWELPQYRFQLVYRK